MKQLILFILLLFGQKIIYAQVSVSKLSLPYGKYEVGFKHYVCNDSTRSYKRLYDFTDKILPRPISVSIWFPAIPKAGTKLMTVEDYMTILKDEEEWEELPNSRILEWFYYSNSESNKSHLAETTKAKGNLRPLSQKFPAVIYAPSYQASSTENFALCEFLATHGFIVISSPSRGTENRFLDGGTTRDIETQARDIEFLIAEISKNSFADINNLAVVGFSFGGISNILAQMMDERIKSIICLDGSIRYQYSKIQQSPYFNLAGFDVPFLFMSQKEIPAQVMKEDNIDSTLNTSFLFYDSLKNSNAYYFKFNDLTHSYFSSMGVLFADRDARQDKSDSAIMKSYKWLNIYTLNFLNAFVKKDNQAKLFLEKQPAENGVLNDAIVKLSEKKAVAKEFSFDDFNMLAIKQNYQSLPALYAAVKSNHPEFKMEEWKLNTLGLSLLFKNKWQAGINILLLNTVLFPESANTYDSLGEGYLITGDKEKALENFKKSLDFNPQNQNAIDRLKALNK
jgi:pimeloyl-ACP methyl ester carboxylesterase